MFWRVLVHRHTWYTAFSAQWFAALFSFIAATHYALNFLDLLLLILPQSVFPSPCHLEWKISLLMEGRSMLHGVLRTISRACSVYTVDVVLLSWRYLFYGIMKWPLSFDLLRWLLDTFLIPPTDKHTHKHHIGQLWLKHTYLSFPIWLSTGSISILYLWVLGLRLPVCGGLAYNIFHKADAYTCILKFVKVYIPNT